MEALMNIVYSSSTLFELYMKIDQSKIMQFYYKIVDSHIVFIVGLIMFILTGVPALKAEFDDRITPSKRNMKAFSISTIVLVLGAAMFYYYWAYRYSPY